MSDYGLRISTEDSDVKDCDDLDTILSTKYAVLKGATMGKSSIIPTVAGATVTIAHGLAYIPVTMVFSGGAQSPLSGGLVDNDFKFWHYADATNLYIKGKTTTGDWDEIFFKYYIYKDKGKI